MAIIKWFSNDSKLSEEPISRGRDCVSGEFKDSHKGSDEEEDVDSGMGSDSVDMIELEEDGGELCQGGDSKFVVPHELYELLDLSDILSIDTWNDCLTEEDRFMLSEFLPDMNQDTFVRTLKELFSGANFHFGRPLSTLWEQMKGGLCRPEVSLYTHGLNFLEKKKHYYFLLKYQNSMVGNLLQIKETWGRCAGYNIEERLRLLNVMRSHKVLVQEKDDEMLNMLSETELGTAEDFNQSLAWGDWKRRTKAKHHSMVQTGAQENLFTAKSGHRLVSDVVPFLGSSFREESGKFAESSMHKRKNPKGILKVAQTNLRNKESKKFVGNPSPLMMQTFTVGSTYRGKSKSKVRIDSPGVEDDHVHGLSHHHSKNDSAMSSIKLSKSARKKGVVNNHDDGARLVIPVENERISEGNFRGNAKSIPQIHQSSENGRVHYGRHQKVHGLEETLMTEPQFDRSCNPYLRGAKKVRQSENQRDSLLNDHMNSLGNRFQRMRSATTHYNKAHVLEERHIEWIESTTFQQNCTADDHRRIQGETFMLDNSVNFDDGDYKKTKKLKCGKIGTRQISQVDNSSNVKVKSSSQLPSRLNYPEEAAFRGSFPYPSFDQGSGMLWDINKKYDRDSQGDYVDDLNDITESDDDTHYSSSEDVDEELEVNARSRNLDHRSQLSKVDDDHLKANRSFLKARKESHEDPGRLHQPSLFETDSSESLQLPKANIYSSKGKQKARSDKLLNGLDGIGDSYDPSHMMLGWDGDSGMLASDCKQTLVTERNDQYRREMWSGMHNVQNADKKHKTKDSLKYLSDPSRIDYRHSYVGGDGETSYEQLQSTKLLKKCQRGETDDFDYASISSLNSERLQMPLLDCKPLKKKKRKSKVEFVEGRVDPGILNYHQAVTNSEAHVEDAIPPKKRGKKTAGGEAGSLGDLSPEQRMSEKGPAKDEQETKLPKKSSTLIKPSEIVNRVKLRPGDPAILKTQEPLQDLVRGVLKMFSAKTAPLGAKAWKPLALYDRASKSWSWTGPLPKSHGSNFSLVETSPDDWGISHNMLGKLVDFYANWLKNGQETLQQIGSLPTPPHNPLPYLDEKERFKDLRAQKSLTTITPSSREARAYFRREEYLRYTVPDRAFAYTAADGRKSVVAPLRRCGGKPTSKARDHFMLKPDRPPHVTVLCLVRDAAARLPGSIGTRADVCTLLRDSQYIVEDVSDAQVNQVVSGALDRLHYELDPCVQFDAERKLWVYLHREREDEDFEDDGTSSTKKWKRQKKEDVEASEPGAASDVVCRGSADQIASGSGAGFELSPDLNAGLSPIYSSGRAELVYNDLRTELEENGPFLEVPNSIDNAPGSLGHGHPMGWEVL